MTPTLPDQSTALTGALKKACDDAYLAGTGSCSNAVWEVIKAMINPAEPYRMANPLIDYMATNWKLVELEDGYNLANKGVVVVGGAKVENGNGHVIVIYPGAKKLNGGYMYHYKKADKDLILQGTKLYPLCLSTSMGKWPGANSSGDKTVWDPWGSDSGFAAVRFYTPKG